MSIFEHAGPKRRKSGPIIKPEARLPPADAILAIGALSLLCWAAAISFGMALWSVVKLVVHF
jgi:hypothetical protein